MIGAQRSVVEHDFSYEKGVAVAMIICPHKPTTCIHLYTDNNYNRAVVYRPIVI